MKSVEQELSVERHGIKEVIKCGMKINAHAFKLLAKQYEDPILALIRELGCNAYDAQSRMGNKETPFIVQIPNSISPEFVVRDFGVGMSHDTMKSVYSNYMNSDKHHTNDETGFFGIGSKSPLAYADSFNINCYDGSTKRIYTVGYGEDGIPELNFHGVVDSDEQQGVEVRVPVSEKDFKYFELKTYEVFTYFDHLPNILGAKEDWNFIPRLISKDNVCILQKFRYGPSVTLVMGNVVYDLDLRRNDINHPLNLNLVIRVPIGSFSITPSRDSIEYNSYSVNSINRILKDAGLTIELLVKEKISEVEGEDVCLYEKYKVYQFLFKLLNIKGNLLDGQCSDLVSFLDKKSIPSQNIGVYGVFKNGDYRLRRNTQIHLTDILSGDVKIVLNNCRGAKEATRKLSIKNPSCAYYMASTDTYNEVDIKKAIMNYFECGTKLNYSSAQPAFSNQAPFYTSNNYCSIDDNRYIKNLAFSQNAVDIIDGAIIFSSSLEVEKTKRKKVTRVIHENVALLDWTKSYSLENCIRYDLPRRIYRPDINNKYFYIPIKNQKAIDGEHNAEALQLYKLLNPQSYSLDEHKKIFNGEGPVNEFSSILLLNTVDLKRLKKGGYDLTPLCDVLKHKRFLKTKLWNYYRKNIYSKVFSDVLHTMVYRNSYVNFIEEFNLLKKEGIADLHQLILQSNQSVKSNIPLSCYSLFYKEEQNIKKEVSEKIRSLIFKICNQYPELFEVAGDVLEIRNYKEIIMSLLSQRN